MGDIFLNGVKLITTAWLPEYFVSLFLPNGCIWRSISANKTIHNSITDTGSIQSVSQAFLLHKAYHFTKHTPSDVWEYFGTCVKLRNEFRISREKLNDRTSMRNFLVPLSELSKLPVKSMTETGVVISFSECKGNIQNSDAQRPMPGLLLW